MGGKNNVFNQAGSALGLSGSGGIFGGSSSLKSGGAFSMTPQAAEAEKQAIALQRGIISGSTPSIAGQQYQLAQNQAQQAGLAQAAAARGVNPALAFRAANQATQMAQQDAGLQSAIMAEEERRNAANAIAQIAAGQRGVALQGAQANLQSREANRGQTLGFLSGVGQAAATAGKK